MKQARSKHCSKAHSILTDDYKHCYICGSTQWIDIHHIYFGPKRKISDENGFVVPLCRHCHTGTGDETHCAGIHFEIELDYKLKAICQKAYEKNHTRAEFMALIGRNYIYE